MEIIIDDIKTAKIDAEFEVVFTIIKSLLIKGHTVKYKNNGIWEDIKEETFPKGNQNESKVGIRSGTRKRIKK